MNAARIIETKRDGGELTDAEIGWFVSGFTRGDVPDYQMAALAMAVYLKGMTAAETAALTQHMLDSGVQLDWSAWDRPVVDKHSSGGLGDKVSLVLAPLLACCDVAVPMISGRCLGPTGGTLDKLESIPGFRTDLSLDELQQVVDRVGCAITGATADLAPADRKLYALRDVTATVPSIPLITASIMSKKLAEGLDALVLDVKWGSGAFMKTLADARHLAESLVATGKRMGVATTAIISDMNQPLGRMIGNAVEVSEAIETLSGGGPADLRELTVELGAELLQTARSDPTAELPRTHLSQILDSGAALEKFREMVAAQSGDLNAPRPRAAESVSESRQAGFVRAIDAARLGHLVIELGGGRKRVGDPIDHSVGIEWLVRIGDMVEPKTPIARVFAVLTKHEFATQEILASVTLVDEALEPPQLIVDRVS
jgi:pyrimidine-nucleoside phosphorylase